MGFHLTALDQQRITEQEAEEEQPIESLYVTSPITSNLLESSDEEDPPDSELKGNVETSLGKSSPDLEQNREPGKKSAKEKKDLQESPLQGLSVNENSDVSNEYLHSTV